jgi:hypothetical protein
VKTPCEILFEPRLSELRFDDECLEDGICEELARTLLELLRKATSQSPPAHLEFPGFCALYYVSTKSWELQSVSSTNVSSSRVTGIALSLAEDRNQSPLCRAEQVLRSESFARRMLVFPHCQHDVSRVPAVGDENRPILRSFHGAARVLVEFVTRECCNGHMARQGRPS